MKDVGGAGLASGIGGKPSTDKLGQSQNVASIMGQGENCAQA